MASSIAAGSTRSSNSLIEKKPRNYIKVLEDYKRLLRLEVEKRHATIETATELDPEAGAQIVAESEATNTAPT